MTASISSIPESFRTLESTQEKEIARTSTLGQEDFLKLLMTQLQNQDPMEPMDNGELSSKSFHKLFIDWHTKISTPLVDSTLIRIHHICLIKTN